MILKNIRKYLDEKGPSSVYQLSYALNEDVEMVKAGVATLLEKKYIEKIVVPHPPCKNCAFAKTCSDEKKDEETALYKLV